MTWRKRLAALAGLVVVTFALAYAWTRIVGPSDAGDEEPAFDPNTVAVLPFRDLSSEGRFGPLAVTLSNEVRRSLSSVDALTVRSAGATRPFADEAVSPDSLGRALGVGSLVEGSVEPLGAGIRLSVQLVDAESGTLLGDAVRTSSLAESAEEYVPLVEDVALALRVALGRHVALLRRLGETGSAAASGLVLRAEESTRLAAESRLAGEIVAAYRLLVRADSLAADAEQEDSDWLYPILLRGWLTVELSELSESVGLRLERAGQDADQGALDAAGWLQEGIGHAERALESEASSAAAHELRGALRYRLRSHVEATEGDRLLAQAESDLRTAVDSDPSLTKAWTYLAYVLEDQGLYTESSAAATRALETDAYLEEGVFPLAGRLFALLRQGRFDQAAVICESGRRRFPDHFAFQECHLTILGWSGASRTDADNAWLELLRIEEGEAEAGTWGFRRMMIAAVLARAGLSDSSRAVVGRTREQVADPALNVSEAFVRLLMGERDEARRLLGEYLEASPQDSQWVAGHPWFRSLDLSEADA